MTLPHPAQSANLYPSPQRQRREKRPKDTPLWRTLTGAFRLACTRDPESMTPYNERSRFTANLLHRLTSRIPIVCTVVMLALGSYLAAAPPGTSQPADTLCTASIRTRTYERLDDVRSKTRQQLTDYLGRVQHQADSIRDDAMMLKCFRLRHSYYQLQQSETPTDDVVRAMNTLDSNIQRYYLQHYSMFYNVIFIDREGTVFYEIRRQGHTGSNMFESPLADSSLAQQLQHTPNQQFVDFQQSIMSREPSAFFAQPAVVQGSFAGWFLLQCSIHRINDIFIRDKGLGSTGEVFLVNRNYQMMTDSRFRRDSSILTQHLSAENIESKFAEGTGHKMVTDYRGQQALTSFEVCRVLNSEWLLIAKIDQAEVLTDYYRTHRDQLRSMLLSRLTEVPVVPATLCQPSEQATVVHVDEFRKIYANEQIVTFGVLTCTAVVIHLPEQFAYLGHASTYDTMYGAGELDILSHMNKRIQTYEICPYQVRRLQVVVTAPHMNSIGYAIDALADAGLFLSQIRFMYNDQAQSAMVWHDTTSSTTMAQWKPSDPTASYVYQSSQDVPSVGHILWQLLDCPESTPTHQSRKNQAP